MDDYVTKREFKHLEDEVERLKRKVGDLESDVDDLERN